MNFEYYKITNDLLGDVAFKKKKLLNAEPIITIAASIIMVVVLHMYVIVSPIPKPERDKIIFLTSFTLFIAAPVTSFILSFAFAFIPIKQETYLQKFVFLTLITLLIIEVVLLCITLVDG